MIHSNRVICRLFNKAILRSRGQVLSKLGRDRRKFQVRQKSELLPPVDTKGNGGHVFRSSRRWLREMAAFMGTVAFTRGTEPSLHELAKKRTEEINIAASFSSHLPPSC